MLPLSRQFRPHRYIPRAFSAPAGFTLVEIVIALAVLGTMAAGVYLGFNAVNTYAVSSRCYSEAQTAAQNQIDLTLSKEPFDVRAAYISGTFDPTLHRIPVELMTVAEVDAVATSGVSFPATAPTSTPATSSSYYPYYPYFRSGAGQPLSKQAFIYQDPVTGKVVVSGTLTFTVTDTVSTMTFIPTAPASTPTPLNVRKADVAVTYSYRRVTADTTGALLHGDYTVRMGTLRTADQ
jgi:prepilin-type N-terminal cleavage/methylation domain-containing protein